MAWSITDQLDAWLVPDLPGDLVVLIELNQQTAPWLLEHRELIASLLDRVRLHQPSHEHVKTALEQDLRKPAAFFRELDLPIQTSGLPACLCPGAQLTEPLRILEPRLFEEGRLKIRELARFHIKEGYRAKSLRCRDCVVKDRCDGAHINFLRDQGLAELEPLTNSTWAQTAQAQLIALHPEPEKRLGNGRMYEAPAKSLPGFVQPDKAKEDPLAVIARNVAKRRAKRREEIRARIAAEREG